MHVGWEMKDMTDLGIMSAVRGIGDESDVLEATATNRKLELEEEITNQNMDYTTCTVLLY